MHCALRVPEGLIDPENDYVQYLVAMHRNTTRNDRPLLFEKLLLSFLSFSRHEKAWVSLFMHPFTIVHALG